MTTPRWYMLNKMGMATLCTDKESAEQEAADAQSVWPHMGPHRAVQLIEAADAQQDSFDHGPQATSIEEAARDVGKWLNERPNRPIDLRHVAMLCAHATAAHQQEAQEPVAVPRFNCWSTNEGDSWFDHPADAQAIYDCLGNNVKVGDEYELTAGWESVTARYRITEVVGDGEEYEVECISHPQENTAPQPSPAVQGEALSDDAVRVPLDSLHADAAYLIGRLREGSMPYARVIEIIRERIDAAKAAIRARAAQGDTPDAARSLFDSGWQACARFCDRDDVSFDGIVGNTGCPEFEMAFDAARAAQEGK